MNPLRLLRPAYLETFSHVRSLLTDPFYRSYWWFEVLLGNHSRYKPTSVRMGALKLAIPDSASFLSSYREIFVGNIYKFSSCTSRPRILDLGANIGLSVLYFKSLYPDADITAVEADPEIFAYLERNVAGNGYDDVRLLNCAAWISDTELAFKSDGADGGRVADGGDQGGKIVPAIDIRQYLEGVDFLKMDVEGAECTIIPTCKGLLQHVSFIFLEYHSRMGEEHNLAEILTVLEREGFRIQVQHISNCLTPLMARTVKSEFDMQLNIFGRKELC